MVWREHEPPVDSRYVAGVWNTTYERECLKCQTHDCKRADNRRLQVVEVSSTTTIPRVFRCIRTEFIDLKLWQSNRRVLQKVDHKVGAEHA